MKHILLNTLILGLFFSATSQNVGIGTSSPAQRLSVSGTLGISETGNTGNRLQISTSGSGADIFQNDNSPIIFRTLTLVNSSQEKMRINDNGNVGIGNNSPAYKLDVAGDVRSAGNGILNSASPTWFFQDNDERSGMIHMNGNLMYFLNGSGTNSLNWSINGSHWPLYINMNNDDAVFGGRALFMEGNVGIADSDPQTPLVVNNNGERLHVYRPIDNTMAIQVSIDNQWANRVSYASGCCNSLSLQPDVGSVGIGTNSPAYKLDINGNMRTTGRYFSNEWIQMDNHSGLYSPLNGAHFYPNNGTYGAWQVQGSRNGWGGIEFASAGGNLTLMMNQGNGWGAQYTGVHNNANGWLWYFLHRTLYTDAYVDMNDANFYVDPNNTTRLNVLNSKLNERGTWGGWNWWGGCGSNDWWMIPVSEGNCFMAGMLGSMQGGGEGAYIRQESGWYVLRVQTCRGANSMYGIATCVGR